MGDSLQHQKMAVDSGHWPLFRFDPRKRDLGQPMLTMDSVIQDGAIGKFIAGETRYRAQRSPEDQASFIAAADQAVRERYRIYQSLAGITSQDVGP
jgi:pyruvate-ferredoxin/flavodoxin oxidoreductase